MIRPRRNPSRTLYGILRSIERGLVTLNSFSGPPDFKAGHCHLSEPRIQARELDRTSENSRSSKRDETSGRNAGAPALIARDQMRPVNLLGEGDGRSITRGRRLSLPGYCRKTRAGCAG